MNYFDNASTTKVDSRVLEAMLPFFYEIWSNESSNHGFGKYSKQAIELSRKQVLECMVIKLKIFTVIQKFINFIYLIHGTNKFEKEWLRNQSFM